MTRLIARNALGELTKLGQGGQGIVYQAPKVKAKFANAMVFKEYKPHIRREVNFEALSAMSDLVTDTLPNHDGLRLISIAAWPCALVESDTGPAGFIMPAIPDPFFIDLTTVKGRSRNSSEFQHLLNPTSVLTARGITVTNKQRYQLVREVAKGLSFLHRIGVCVGDVSPKNVLFSLNPRPAVYFVDCDAMRVNGISALPQMETPEWQVPPGEELATIYSDTYKLGLLALRLLTGNQQTRNPQELPPTTPKPLRQLITDTLTKKPDHRPLPEAWTYLLGHVIDQAQQNKTDPRVTPPTPAALPHSPEPVPVVRTRPSDSSAPVPPPPKHAASTPAPNPAPSAVGTSLTYEQKFFAVAGIVLLFIIVIIFAASNRASDTTTATRSPSRTLPTSSTTLPTSTSRPSGPQMSGDYLETRTYSPTGQSVTNHWHFTPCGEGCAEAESSTALLVDGQWTMETIANIICEDGSAATDAAKVHLIWDPYTLAGEADVTQLRPVCGDDAADTYTLKIQFRKSEG